MKIDEYADFKSPDEESQTVVLRRRCTQDLGADQKD
jgi:hypothetical protein